MSKFPTLRPLIDNAPREKILKCVEYLKTEIGLDERLVCYERLTISSIALFVLHQNGVPLNPFLEYLRLIAEEASKEPTDVIPLYFKCLDWFVKGKLCLTWDGYLLAACFREAPYKLDTRYAFKPSYCPKYSAEPVDIAKMALINPLTFDLCERSSIIIPENLPLEHFYDSYEIHTLLTKPEYPVIIFKPHDLESFAVYAAEEPEIF